MELIKSGKIVNTHGIRGEIKIQPWTDSPLSLARESRLWLEDGTVLELSRARVHGDIVVAAVKGVNDVDSAEALKNREVYAEREPLEPGQFYIADIIGLEVIDADTGESYGRLTEVYQCPANDAYELTMVSGQKVLFPAIKQVIVSTCIEEKTMRIRPLTGMFDI